MKTITNFTDYKINENTVEVEETVEGVYVLTLTDVMDIVNSFSDTNIEEKDILNELENYKFVKVEDVEIDTIDELSPGEDLEIEDPLADDITGQEADENPNLIKKFEE